MKLIALLLAEILRTLVNIREEQAKRPRSDTRWIDKLVEDNKDW